MLRKILGLVLLFGVALGQMLTLQRCANPLPPKGGPRDSIGPMVVIEESTAPFQTNFRPQQIELTFNEWVKIKDPTQVIISPPISPPPKLSLKKKTLLIDFGDATLRDSATYVINIGGAVVDLTESNPPDNLRYVFATGPELDSASVSGRLLDAYTKEPIKDALFSLYANLADTAVSTENPFYFAQSDDKGFFNISNIRPGVYRGVALNNGGQINYLFNARSTEQIGFPDSLLLVPDSALVLPDVLLSPPPLPLRRLNRDTSNFGRVQMVFDRPAEEVLLDSRRAYRRINELDTLRLFYTENQSDTLLFGTDRYPMTDTLVLLSRSESRQNFRGNPVIEKKIERSLSSLKRPELQFSRPLSMLNDSFIQLRRDTFPEPIPITLAVDSQATHVVYLSSSLKAQEKYELTLLPGAVTDIFGKNNLDTITTAFSLLPLTDLGTLTLFLKNFDPAKSYLLQLVKKVGEKPIETIVVNDQKAEYERTLRGLIPATYLLEIIQDNNGNGRFDGADYERQSQPEPVWVFTLEALRADWEVEAIIDLAEITSKKKSEIPKPGIRK
jgi:hypothetical protein